MPSSRVTMKYFEIPNGRLPTPPYDAVFTGRSQDRDENEPPPAILLDFMYGAAAYERWGNGQEMARVIHDNFVQNYKDIPIVLEPDDSFGEDSGSKPDGPADGDCVDPGSSNPVGRRQNSESIINAMDNMNALMMHMSGLTPEIRMAKWQKEVEEEQSKKEVISRSKVLEWMNR